MIKDLIKNSSAEEQLKDCAEFLSSHDLVNLGLFPSPDAVYFARLRGNSPDFIKMNRKVIYPKASVIKFIEQRMVKGTDERVSESKPSNPSESLIQRLEFKNSKLSLMVTNLQLQIKENERRIEELREII